MGGRKHCLLTEDTRKSSEKAGIQTFPNPPARVNPNRPTIRLLNCYFGEWPPWMPAFLESCRWNPDVEWLLIGDAPLPARVPGNVSFIPFTLDQFNDKATKALGFQVRIERDNAYKLCDFKPTYGLIFSDLLDDTDFWGHCDVDVVWGDIRGFLTDRLLCKHDLLTSRKRRFAGHFTIYRNAPTINRMILALPGLKNLLQSPLHHSVDESQQYAFHAIREKTISRRLQRLFLPAAMRKPPRIYWKRELATASGEQVKVENGQADPFRWQAGKVFDGRHQELMYVHFHYLKARMNRFDPVDRPERMLIDQDGIRISDVSDA
jgi:hypothetical protein